MKTLRQMFYIWGSLTVLSIAIHTGCASGPATQPTTFLLTYEPVKSTLQNDTGWSIQLDKAELTFQAFRFRELHGHASLQPSEWLKILSPIQTAYAHPGHFDGDEVKAELLFDKSLDLIATKPVDLGTVQGYTGSYGTASISLKKDSALVLHGTAKKSEQSVTFKISLPLSKRDIDGIPFQHNLTQKMQTFRMKLDIATWFASIDFDKFSNEQPDQASKELLEKTLMSSSSYAFQWDTTN